MKKDKTCPILFLIERLRPNAMSSDEVVCDERCAWRVGDKCVLVAIAERINSKS